MGEFNANQLLNPLPQQIPVTTISGTSSEDAKAESSSEDELEIKAPNKLENDQNPIAELSVDESESELENELELEKDSPKEDKKDAVLPEEKEKKEETTKTGLVPPIIHCSHMEPMEKKEVGHKQRVNLTLPEFFQKYFSDDSREFLMSVNNHLQYYDFHLDEWTKEDCCLSRKHSFTAPLNQTFGPKSANVEQIHRCTFENENHFIFQAFSQSKNTPYCDTYAVLTQYEAEKKSTIWH